MLTRKDRDEFCEILDEQGVRLKNIEGIGGRGDVQMMLCDDEGEIALFVCDGKDQSIYSPTGGVVNIRLLKDFGKWVKRFSRSSAGDWLSAEEAVGEMYAHYKQKKKTAVPVKIKVLGVDADGFEWELPFILFG